MRSATRLLFRAPLKSLRRNIPRSRSILAVPPPRMLPRFNRAGVLASFSFVIELRIGPAATAYARPVSSCPVGAVAFSQRYVSMKPTACQTAGLTACREVDLYVELFPLFDVGGEVAGDENQGGRGVTENFVGIGDAAAGHFPDEDSAVVGRRGIFAGVIQTGDETNAVQDHRRIPHNLGLVADVIDGDFLFFKQVLFLLFGVLKVLSYIELLAAMQSSHRVRQKPIGGRNREAWADPRMNRIRNIHDRNVRPDGLLRE